MPVSLRLIRAPTSTRRRAICYHACMKELIRTNDVTVVAHATALLEGEGIMVFVMDAHMSVLEGSIGVLPRRMMVADRDFFMARAVLRDNGIELPGE